MRNFGVRKRSRRFLFMCSTVAVVVLGGAIAVASGAYPISGVTVYTGCLSNGTIVKVAPNPTKPLHACLTGQALVHLSGGTITSITATPGGGLSGGGSNGAVSLGLAAAYQLPQGCTVGQIAKANGSGAWTCGTPQSPQVFSSSGTYTVPSGVSWVEVEVWGAGGGGASGMPNYGEDGGGGGAVAVGLLPVGACGTVAVTVGIGGAGGTAPPASGQDGASSSASCDGNSVAAGGGAGGAWQPGGAGGTAVFSAAAVALSNSPGNSGMPLSGGFFGGAGGNNGGGSGGAAGNNSSSASGGVGGGGQGGSGSPGTGGNGGNGLVLIIPSA